MKRTVHILLVAAMMLALGACTRNHGDIGMWFGTWHVESTTVNGSTVSHEGDYFFQFQSHAFRVSLVGDREQLVESFGTWEEGEDGTLTITFPDPSVFYIQMPGLEDYNAFAVSDLTGGRITLNKAMADGTPVVYTLKKQP